MQVKQFVITKMSTGYDTEKLSEKLTGSVRVETLQEGPEEYRRIVVYAFYPDNVVVED